VQGEAGEALQNGNAHRLAWRTEEELMPWLNRGRRRRQCLALRRRFDMECRAFLIELGITLARLREQGKAA
jgi:hypothetical protein